MPICFPLPNGELGLVIVDPVPKTMFLQSRLDWYYPPQLSVDANSDRSLVIQSFATIDRLRLTPRAPRRRVPVTVLRWKETASQVKIDSDGSQIGSMFTHNRSQNATFLGRCNSSLTLKQLQGCRPIRLRKPNGVKLDALGGDHRAPLESDSHRPRSGNADRRKHGPRELSRCGVGSTVNAHRKTNSHETGWQKLNGRNRSPISSAGVARSNVFF